MYAHKCARDWLTTQANQLVSGSHEAITVELDRAH